MKRLHILSILIIIFISSLLIYSCSKENKIPNGAPQHTLSFKENGISVNYSSNIEDGFLNFSIHIQDDKSGNSIAEAFKVNTDKKLLSADITEQINLKQRSLSPKFSQTEISNMLTVMNNMIHSITTNITDKELLDLKVQGLFMSKSLLQSINRQIIKNNQNSSFSTSSFLNDYEDATVFTSNTVYEGFNRGFSSFSLSEDLIVNIKDFEGAINQGSQNTKSAEFQFIQTALGNIHANNVSIYELEVELVRYTENNPDKFEGSVSTFGYKWPKGSDHGCCGNYDGDCLFFHPICYLHDKMCQNCTPRWFCLPGCKIDRA
jgi:hypothetical protein